MIKTFFCVFMLCLSCYSSAKQALPEFNITQIDDNVYLHQSFQNIENFGVVSSNGLVVIDGNNAFIIDTPWSVLDTETLIRWIQQQDLKVAASLSTHYHEDRTAGIKRLNALGIPTYASRLTNKILKQKNKAQAKYLFETSVFQLENGFIEVFYPGGGHTIDNMVVWLPKTKTLIGGCLVRSLHSKSLGYTGEATIKQWPNTIDKVLAKYPNAKRVVPGHGKLGNKTLLTHTKQLAQREATKH